MSVSQAVPSEGEEITAHSNPVYHRGRPAHWHWTLSRLKEGRGTRVKALAPDKSQKRKSPKKEPWRISVLTWLSIYNGFLMHLTWGGQDHAKKPLESWELQQRRRNDTEAQRTQPTGYTDVTWRQAHPPLGSVLVLFFFLPCSKNSDLRFKFFKDMGSDSTWEMENRIKWGEKHI